MENNDELIYTLIVINVRSVKQMKKTHSPLPNLDTVDIKLLRVFAAVVRNKGFSAAQMELNVNQPTISSHMSQLEVRLGLRLCHRGRSGFRLTTEGEQVYEAAQTLFNAIEIFKTDIGSFKGQLVGEIHIGMVDALVTNTQFKLPQIAKKFNEKAPDVKLHIHKKSPHALYRSILDEQINFAIAPNSKISDSVQTFPIFDESQVLYCAKNHPLFELSDKAISKKMLESTPYAGRDFPYSFAPDNLPQFTPASISNDMECIATLILSGNYIGYLPKHYADGWVKQKLMRPIFENKFSYQSEFSLYYKESKLNLATKLFLKIVEEIYSA